MKTETFDQVAKALQALGCTTAEGVLDVSKIKDFLTKIAIFESDIKDLITFYEANHLADSKVVIDKTGKVHLVRVFKINKPKDGEISWAGVEVLDNKGNATIRAMDEVLPFNETSKVLYGAK